MRTREAAAILVNKPDNRPHLLSHERQKALISEEYALRNLNIIDSVTVRLQLLKSTSFLRAARSLELAWVRCAFFAPNDPGTGPIGSGRTHRLCRPIVFRPMHLGPLCLPVFAWLRPSHIWQTCLAPMPATGQPPARYQTRNPQRTNCPRRRKTSARIKRIMQYRSITGVRLCLSKT